MLDEGELAALEDLARSRGEVEVYESIFQLSLKMVNKLQTGGGIRFIRLKRPVPEYA